LIVVDSSVAVKWLLAEAHSDRADALYARSTSTPEHIIAPPLFRLEMTNIVWQRVRRQDITPARAEELLNAFLGMHVLIVSSPDADRTALKLARDFDLPATYDAYYIALAQHAGAALWTADERLLRALDGRLPFVRWIGDYS